MRLNLGYRAEIVRAAIEGAFAKEDKKLAQREHALAKRCYDLCIPAKVRKLTEQMPPDWLCEASHLCFNINGMTLSLAAEHRMPVPAQSQAKYSDAGRLGAISDAQIGKDVLALMADKDAVRARKNKAEITLKALVDQHSTTDELGKHWPEGRTYWKALERKIPVSNLPAVRIEELNSMLGLAHASS